MLDIGWTELLIIAVVAIIVVGPKDLPGMLRSLGRYAGQLRRTANEFRDQFDEALRESELDELRAGVEDIADLNPVTQVKNTISESLDPLRETADEIRGDIERAGRPDTTKKPAVDAQAPPEPAERGAEDEGADDSRPAVTEQVGAKR